jgi:hypothetical protein
MKTLFVVVCLLMAMAFTASAQRCYSHRECEVGDHCDFDIGYCGPGEPGGGGDTAPCPATCGCPGAGPLCVPPISQFKLKLTLVKPSPSKTPVYEYSKTTVAMKEVLQASVAEEKKKISPPPPK